MGQITGAPGVPGTPCTDHTFTLPPTGQTFQVTVIDATTGCGGDIQIASVCVTGINGAVLPYCGADEAGECRIYHSPPGCDQCWPGAFKKSYDHPCVDCQETFGNVCIGCNDHSGCCECRPINDFTLTRDDFTGLWYCKPNPCLNPDNHCRVCNNGLCSQCQEGYPNMAADRSCCF